MNRVSPMKQTRSLALLLLASLASPVLAQAPAGDVAKPAGDATTPQDDPLYSCKRRTGLVSVTFKPETELGRIA